MCHTVNHITNDWTVYTVPPLYTVYKEKHSCEVRVRSHHYGKITNSILISYGPRHRTTYWMIHTAPSSTCAPPPPWREGVEQGKNMGVFASPAECAVEAQKEG